MKNVLKSVLGILLIIVTCATLSACGNSSVEHNLWDNATYKEDTELGSGAKTMLIEVVAEDKSITFEIHTDKDTVGEALLEHELVSGEKSAYGLYVKTVNGIEADYDKTKSFWAFCKNGESLMTGVDGEELSDGSHYELVYTQQ